MNGGRACHILQRRRTGDHYNDNPGGMRMRNTTRLLFATAILFICLVASTQASAAVGSYVCTPTGGKQITSVIWDGNGLYVRCGGTSLVFYAKKGASCSGSAEGTTSFDTIKIWESLVSTA